MAGSRTLKLSILGDVSYLNKSLKAGAADVDTFGDKIGKAGKMIGAAFAAAAAAAAAYAIKIGIDGVKAAIEDEKAQTQLALALENATGATKGQIAETEKQILKMSLASGVADDDLRPSLARLARATGDTEEAQKLLAMAMDISAATGKPLETVSNALAKGFEGNSAALGKLGIGLSAAEIKTMTFTDVQGKLTELFGGAAAANAETYSGKIARMQVAFNEAKETIGIALLPILEKLMNFINENALPAIEAFAGAFSVTNGQGLGKIITDVVNVVRDVAEPVFTAWVTVFDKLKKVIVDNKDNFQAFFDVVKALAPILGKTIGAAVTVIGDVAEVVLAVFAKVLGALKPLINGAIDGINAIISAYNKLPFPNISLIPKIGSTGGASTGTPGFISGGAKTGTGTGTTGTGTGTGATSGAVGAVGAGAVAAGVKAGAAAAAAAVITGDIGGTTGNIGEAMFEIRQRETGFAVPTIPSTGGGFTDSQNTQRLIADQAAVISKMTDINSRQMDIRARERGDIPQINITVNGATNSEDAARVIVDTLNRSTYRGTGGSINLVTIA